MATGTPDPTSNNGFSSLLGVDPNTPMQDLPDTSLILSCALFADYFDARVPEADIIRSLCVTDAVFGQGALTTAACDTAAGQCIATAAPLPPTVCVGRGPNFVCTSSVGQYEQCVEDYTMAKQAELALFVCANVEDPDIQAKLDDAAAEPASCAAFRSGCPTFFPDPSGVPAPGDGGAP